MKRTFILFVAMVFGLIVLSQEKEASPKLKIWSGQFPFNPKLTVTYALLKSDGITTAYSFLLDNNSILNEVQVEFINPSINLVEFHDNSTGVIYKGEIVEDSLINGKLIVPGGEPVALTIKMLSEDSPEWMTIKKALSPIDITSLLKQSRLIEDFDFLVKNLKENHPMLYQYQSMEDFDNMVNNTRLKINRDLNLFEFLNIVSPIVSRASCVHTDIRLSAKQMEAMVNQTNSFPLVINFIDGGYYNLADFNNNLISAGAEISTINGVEISEIYSRLLKDIPSDGKNITHKISRLNESLWQYLHYIDDSNSFIVEYKNPGDNELKRIVIDAIPTVEVITIYSDKLDHNKEGEMLDFYTIDDNLAIMTIKGFFFPDFESYLYQLNTIFKELKERNIQNLIVDLRGNMGGMPFFSSELLRFFLHDTNTIYFKDNGLDDFMKPLGVPMKFTDYNFEGETWFIADGNCLSSTGHFLSLIKEYKLGKIAGEEPGGSFYCNDNSVHIILPYSGLEVSIARSVFETGVNDWTYGQPVIVDVEISPTINSVISGNDMVLDSIISIINK